VWNGERASTTGGLKKSDLMKNRHGRIVSKRKSEVARKLNNLGNFLASKAKAAGQEPKPAPKPKPKPKPEPPKVAPPKPKPKPAPAPAPKPKPKPAPPKVAPKKKRRTPEERRALYKAMLEERKMKDTGYIKNVTKDPEVVAERKKKGRHFKSTVDPANIIPNQRAGLPGKLKKAPKKKKKIEVIDLSGGRLRRITQKQLDQAKKKQVPRRPKKRRRRQPKRDTLSLTV
jgi:pyruvate/2-oxoglutarate dehydrogenase complex dihydrolipoamide acyltransferase (E2) component